MFLHHRQLDNDYDKSLDFVPLFVRRISNSSSLSFCQWFNVNAAMHTYIGRVWKCRAHSFQLATWGPLHHPKYQHQRLLIGAKWVSKRIRHGMMRELSPKYLLSRWQFLAGFKRSGIFCTIRMAVVWL